MKMAALRKITDTEIYVVHQKKKIHTDESVHHNSSYLQLIDSNGARRPFYIWLIQNLTLMSVFSLLW